jgi:hypothetical protein
MTLNILIIPKSFILTSIYQASDLYFHLLTCMIFPKHVVHMTSFL